MDTKRQIFVLTAVLLMAAFAQAASPLVGKWQSTGTAPKMNLIFSANGSYQVDTTGDGKADFSGKYTIKPNLRVVFSEKGQASGLYEYEADGPALRLLLDTDPNDARKDVFTKNRWVRN